VANPPAPAAFSALVNLPARASGAAGVSPVVSGSAGGSQIFGHVSLFGAPPPELPIQLDAVCGRSQPSPLTTRHYVVNDEGRLANVFVYLKDGLQNLRFAVATNTPVLDNVGCLFEPYVLGVQVGQKFKIRNSDPTLHNAHATPRLNREFNSTLPSKGQMVERSFSVPEVLVRVRCDVHPWMFAYIGVVAHPFFAVTDDDGAFSFPPGIPPGRYSVAAVHPKAGEVLQQVTLSAVERKALEFTFVAPGAQ
jgi:plastocyanin